MALSRNFRTTYYKTLGVPVVQHIVDVEASFSALLGERAVNVPQLLKLALELGVPPRFRARTWTVLCGVLPAYPALWGFAARERRAMFHDVVRAAQVLQAKDGGLDDADGHERGADEADHVFYHDFLALLKEEDEEDEREDEDERADTTTTARALRRLVHLHRTYWWEIAARQEPLLGMDNSHLLLGVARVLCAVLPREADRFWCFVHVLELFHDGLELVEPPVPLSALYDAQVPDFELLLLRTLDVKRRRFTADAPLSSLH